AAALARHGAGDYPSGDGLNFWLPLSAASQPLALRLARAGWLVREGEAFGVKTSAHGLRLSLGALTEAQIEQLAHDLSLVLPC
ncbi:MAG UNVERIFIED_CONTAM: transcriptional regulator PtsJ, partial [Klebsiella aerogenes]